jgi:hypothetical protein
MPPTFYRNARFDPDQRPWHAVATFCAPDVPSGGRSGVTIQSGVRANDAEIALRTRLPPACRDLDTHEEAQKAVDYLADKVVAMKYEVLSEHKVAHASASGLIFGAIAGGFQCPDQSP